MTEYNMFRWYRPSWGRYTQTDPLGLRIDVNLYAYVRSQPTGRTDPFGLFCTKDFVLHYFFGGGKAIDLAAVGLLNAYLTSPSVAAEMIGERKAMRSHAANMAGWLCKDDCAGIVHGGFSTSGRYFVNTATPQSDPCLFSLGSSILAVSTTCTVTADCGKRTFVHHCGSQWKLRDEFANPLSLGKGRGTARGYNFGKPYPITADWFDTFSGSGRF